MPPTVGSAASPIVDRIAAIPAIVALGSRAAGVTCGQEAPESGACISIEIRCCIRKRVRPYRRGLRRWRRGSGCSSGVEHNLAKVGVERSNRFTRSSFPYREIKRTNRPPLGGRFAFGAVSPPCRHSLVRGYLPARNLTPDRTQRARPTTTASKPCRPIATPGSASCFPDDRRFDLVKKRRVAANAVFIAWAGRG